MFTISFLFLNHRLAEVLLPVARTKEFRDAAAELLVVLIVRDVLKQLARDVSIRHFHKIISVIIYDCPLLIDSSGHSFKVCER